jgi:aldehyde dehydrogenase (NAD+)
VLPVIEYDKIDDAIEFITARPKPLALYLFSNKRKIQKKVMHQVSFGGGCINDVVMHIANQHLPFGGIGGSGMGSYHGKRSFDTFTHYKGILKNRNWPDIPVRYAPYSKLKMFLLKKILG